MEPDRPDRVPARAKAREDAGMTIPISPGMPDWAVDLEKARARVKARVRAGAAGKAAGVAAGNSHAGRIQIRQEAEGVYDPVITALRRIY